MFPGCRKREHWGRLELCGFVLCGRVDPGAGGMALLGEAPSSHTRCYGLKVCVPLPSQIPMLKPYLSM